MRPVQLESKVLVPLRTKTLASLEKFAGKILLQKVSQIVGQRKGRECASSFL
jgi:hypothetical protein